MASIWHNDDEDDEDEMHEDLDSSCEEEYDRISEDSDEKKNGDKTSKAQAMTLLYEETLSSIRPKTSPIKHDNIEVLIIDVSLKPSFDKKSTEAILFGRERQGGSVCVFASGWQPYLYIQAPKGWVADCDCVLKELLEEKLQTRLQLKFASNGKGGKRRGGRVEAMYAVSTVKRKSMFGYSPGGLTEYLKLEVAHQYLILSLIDVFDGYETHDGNCVKGVMLLMDWAHGIPKLIEGKTRTFNSNIDSVLQFMVDVGLFGCQWCKISNASETEVITGDKRSTCLREQEIKICDLEILNLDEHSDMGFLRVLSFDIEAAGRRGVFPDASYDPVIQIALDFHVFGDCDHDPEPILLSLRSCENIEGAKVLCFDDELELLNAFTELVVAFDADVLTGYNICNFDFPYLLKRANTLEREESSDFGLMTRMLNEQMYVRETIFQSAQTGKRKRVRVGIPGRVCLDMFTCIQNSQSKLEKYTLNAVAEFYLGDKKVDLSFTQITPMWEKDSFARRELGIYCLKDAKLPMVLLEKLDSVPQTAEMARCTGIPLDWVLQRGVMIRNTSLLLRRAKERSFVFPNMKTAGGGANQITGRAKGFEGATVLDAHAGIHKNVGVLDFAAMYPSIIRAHNLCYSTIVLDVANEPGAKHLLLRVNGHCFVPEEIAKGLIPEVVEILQECRMKAKKAFAAETDPVKKKTSKARELAFKVACNGVYGGMGSEQSILPFLAVAETVTAIGRNDIKDVKRLAEEMYPDALVVYGDTDSVFVRFSIPKEVVTIIDAVQMSMDMAKALAEKVNLIMKTPKQIEFEKVYSTMVCLSKKRYAGVMYAAGHKFGLEEPPIDIKGMQCVRRDGCSLVRDLVRECLMSILHTGTFVEAAATARLRLIEIMDDKIPLEAYAVQKVLRKSMQDCCFPMTPIQIKTVRLAIGSSIIDDNQQLSYAEQDDAIRKKVALPWKLRIRLPHIMLAWRWRLQDPGSAPVLGETLSYIVTNNGGKQIFEKVNTIDMVRAKKLFVDRQYYLNSLRVPLENIFLPICIQNCPSSTLSGSALKQKENQARGKMEVEKLIWRVVKGRALKHDAVLRRESIECSPIAMAFKKAATASKPISLEL